MTTTPFNLPLEIQPSSSTTTQPPALINSINSFLTDAILNSDVEIPDSLKERLNQEKLVAFSLSPPHSSSLPYTYTLHSSFISLALTDSQRILHFAFFLLLHFIIVQFHTQFKYIDNNVYIYMYM